MQQRTGRIECIDRIDDRGQRFVVDLDQIERVLRQIAICRDDDRNRLADVAHTVDCDRPTFDRRLHAGDKARRERRDIRTGENRGNAVRLARRIETDRRNAGMRMGRAQDCGMQRAGPNAEVIDKAPAPGQECGVFHALDRLAAPGRCDCHTLGSP